MWRCVQGPVRWIGAWISTRQWRYLLQGSPALLAVGFIACVLFAQTIKAPITDIERYRSSVREALIEKDWETADLWQRKLAQMGANDEETQFRAALVASELGRHQRAQQLMHELAPDDSVGYPEAHFWIADWMTRKGTQIPEDLDAFVHHLEVATGSRFAIQAHTQLARVYALKKEHGKALDHLQHAVEAHPELRFQMVHLYREIGNATEAHRQLEIAERVYSERVESNAGDVASRLQLATAYSMQGRFGTAEAIIQDGMVESQDPQLGSALAGVYALNAAQLQSAGDDQLSSVLGLLQQSLTHVPNHPLAINQLVQFLPQAGTEQPPAVLWDALAAGNSAAVVHLILAAHELNQIKGPSALLHLQHAYLLNPKMPHVLNSLAIRLANLDATQRTLAYQLVTLSLKTQPNNLEIRATRGQILATQGKWEESLVDLKAALSEFDGNPGLHAALSRVYQQLGQNDLAKMHRDRALEANAQQSQNALEKYGDLSDKKK